MVTYLFYSIFKTHIGGEHARIKSKAEPTALTDYKKSLLFGEVCPASKKKKKKNIQSFARQFSFLRISFFSFFFSIFFSTGATDFTEKKKLLVFHYTKYHT